MAWLAAQFGEPCISRAGGRLLLESLILSQEFGFHSGNQALCEIIQFHSEDPEVVDQPVIAEHGRDRNQQACNGGYESGGDAWGHGGEVGASALGGGGGDAAEGGHDAPNRAEQAQEGGAADSDGEEDQAGLQAEGLPGDGAFKKSLDVLH